ncbi:hypothetical protein LCGC14_1005890 [marine sediment metagenome]|uniref:Uncharacterized protein n=1 Tax=marine sediment metagenome TaxID=412755 RepID=A0A0F9N1T7_9ZZZZ
MTLPWKSKRNELRGLCHRCFNSDVLLTIEKGEIVCHGCVWVVAEERGSDPEDIPE